MRGRACTTRRRRAPASAWRRWSVCVPPSPIPWWPSPIRRARIPGCSRPARARPLERRLPGHRPSRRARARRAAPSHRAVRSRHAVLGWPRPDRSTPAGAPTLDAGARRRHVRGAAAGPRPQWDRARRVVVERRQSIRAPALRGPLARASFLLPTQRGGVRDRDPTRARRSLLRDRRHRRHGQRDDLAGPQGTVRVSGSTDAHGSSTGRHRLSSRGSSGVHRRCGSPGSGQVASSSPGVALAKSGSLPVNSASTPG